MYTGISIHYYIAFIATPSIYIIEYMTMQLILQFQNNQTNASRKDFSQRY